MKRKITVSIFSCLLVLSCKAQHGLFDGMANASVSLSDLWSVNSNQAGLASLTQLQLGAYYENKFQLKETSTQGFAFAMPTQWGTFSINYNHYGYQLYAENAGGLGYARSLGPHVQAAVQFDYYHYYQTAYYGQRGVVLLELGLIVSPLENLHIGVHSFNPGQAKLAEYQTERVPSTFRIGAAYDFSNQVVFTAELHKGIDDALRFKTGVSYEAVEHLFFRMGLGTAPTEFAWGLGYALNELYFDLDFSTHPTLPISSQLALKYRF